jgi:hypothetical protein
MGMGLSLGKGLMREQRRRWSWLPLSVLVCVLAVVATGVDSASANVTLKAGTQVNTTQTNCFPSFVTPAYSQQLAGVEPKVGDVFYLSLRVDFLVSFDCAADFFSAQATLPVGLQPAVGGSATTICRRWGKNASNLDVFDARAQTNCVANPPFNATTRVMTLRPVGSPVLPDVGGPGGSFWFTGIRSPQESQEYTSVQLLVPVKGSSQITGQPIEFQVCTVGTDCVTGSVNLTVGAGPVNADPPLVSLPGASQTSAVGARVPFTINDNPTGSSYYLKVDTSTNPAFPVSNTPVHRVCGATLPLLYQSSASMPFSGQTTSEIQYGDLQTGGTTCYLSPQTTYHVKVCSASTVSPFPDLNCRTTSFTTGAVNVTMELPGGDPQPSNALSVLTRVLAGHPVGNTKVQRRLSSSGPAAPFTDASGLVAVAEATTNTPPVSQAVVLPDPWRAYDLRACFVAAATACSNSIRHLAGFAESVADASSLTTTSAVVSGRASTPRPAGTMSIRFGATDPGGADPVAALPQSSSVELPADTSTAQAAPTSVVLTGLQPATKYWWTACFDNPADAGVEDCGGIRSFTTLAPDPEDPPDPPDPQESASISRVSVRGPSKLSRGRTATYRVTITNSGGAAASGVRLNVSGRVLAASVPVGSIPGKAVKTVRVGLKPKKTGRLVAVFKVTSVDAGSRTVRKSLVVGR